MSPDEINAKHGRPSWRCWHCGAESGLAWWRDMSLAYCPRKQECCDALQAFFDSEMEKQAAQEASDREYWG